MMTTTVTIKQHVHDLATRQLHWLFVMHSWSHDQLTTAHVQPANIRRHHISIVSMENNIQHVVFDCRAALAKVGHPGRLLFCKLHYCWISDEKVLNV